jgi:hypothetical protein
MDNNQVSTSAERPKEMHISLATHDMAEIRLALSIMVEAINKGPKSRARALVVTKLQEAYFWADEANRTD